MYLNSYGIFGFSHITDEFVCVRLLRFWGARIFMIEQSICIIEQRSMDAGLLDRKITTKYLGFNTEISRRAFLVSSL